jgi:transposase-like protein
MLCGCIFVSRSVARDVEELLAQRGIVVTYETVRQWCLKFGQTYANELRRRRPRCGDKWHLDEVYREHQRKNALSLESCGSGWQRARHTRRRVDATKKATKRFFRKLLKGLQYVPRVIITDKLKSYGAAKREILPGIEHRPTQVNMSRTTRASSGTTSKRATPAPSCAASRAIALRGTTQDTHCADLRAMPFAAPAALQDFGPFIFGDHALDL